VETGFGPTKRLVAAPSTAQVDEASRRDDEVVYAPAAVDEETTSPKASVQSFSSQKLSD
jgi:hypothetical protein